MKYTAYAIIAIGFMIAAYGTIGLANSQQPATPIENAPISAVPGPLALMGFGGAMIAIGIAIMAFGGKGYVITRRGFTRRPTAVEPKA